MDASTQARVETKAVEQPFGPFERMLALRYLGTKREYGGLAFISVVSVVGITLGVMALIVVMSVMNGFRLELISKIIGFEPHLFVTSAGLPKEQVDALMEEIRLEPGILSVEPMSEGTALAAAYGRAEGVQVRGVRPEDLRANELISKSIAEGANLRAIPVAEQPPDLWRRPLGDGTLDTFGTAEYGLPNQIVIGDGFAQTLAVGVGDQIRLTQSNGASTVAGRVGRSRDFTVTAVYHVGNERYDRYIAFLPIEAAKSFFGDDQGYPIVGIRISNPDAANDVARSLSEKHALQITSWIDRNGTYVTALMVERNVMGLILFIVVIITALNIITGVLMLVKNKARDIAILRTIGATRSGVVRIFLMSGTVLGSAGVATGVALGVLFATFIAPIQHFLEGVIRFFNPSFEGLFPRSIYVLDALPAKLEWVEVGTVAGAAFIVTLFMSIIPSMWAARLNPVEALRFE